MTGTAIELAIERAGGQSALASKIGHGVKQQNVWWWANKGAVPAQHCAAIEAVTGVRRNDLRPDVFAAASRLTELDDAATGGPMNEPIFSERIEWCVDKGMTHREIGERVGLDQSTIRMLHDGSLQHPILPEPAHEALVALSEACRPAEVCGFDVAGVPSMGELSEVFVLASRASKPERSATARNLESAIRERIARSSQLEVGKDAGIEKTAVHRIVAGERGVYLDELHDFLRALGMSAIDCDGDLVTIPKELFESLRVLAKRGLDE